MLNVIASTYAALESLYKICFLAFNKTKVCSKREQGILLTFEAQGLPLNFASAFHRIVYNAKEYCIIL